jgi:hypothetical protein
VTTGPLLEPQLHTHVLDGLPDTHPLAFRRVMCARCNTPIHLQSNGCMRTWVESGRGNFCLRCFVLVAGGLSPDETRLAGADCLPPAFGVRGGS